MLASHNRLRALHGVAPLHLSTEVKVMYVNLSNRVFIQICSQAQSFAEVMVKDDRFQLSSTPYGANIMISSIQMVSISYKSNSWTLITGVRRGSSIPVVQWGGALHLRLRVLAVQDRWRTSKRKHYFLLPSLRKLQPGFVASHQGAGCGVGQQPGNWQGDISNGCSLH